MKSKILALVLAMLLVVGSFAALAEGELNTTITVNQIRVGDTLKLYKLAAASVNATTNEIEYTWATGFSADDFTFTDEGLVFNQNSDGQLAAMAAMTKVKANSIAAEYSFQATGTAGELGTATGTIAPGYYLGFVEGTEDSGLIYQRMLINAVPVANESGDGTYVAHPAITFNVKSEPITITKTEYDPASAAQAHTTDGYYLNDTIPFTINTFMPSYPNTSVNATAIITDSPTGLDDKVNTVKVYINGSETETAAGDTTFSVVRDGDHGFKITFVKSFILAHPAEAIKVTYDAELIGPVDDHGKTENTASIEYNPNPHETTTYKPDDTDEQFEYGLVVYKYEEGKKDTKPLQGAEFELYESKVVNEATVIDETKKVRGATATDAQGLLAWEGLKAGIYFLKETKAPAGYTKITDPIQVEIVKTTATGDNPLTQATEYYFLRAEVPNTPGQSLPETGGMGTTILYVGGSILVVLAAVLLITKRRMNAND